MRMVARGISGKRAVFHVWKTITRKMPFLDALFVRGNERRAISKHRMN